MAVEKYARRERDPTTAVRMHFFISLRSFSPANENSTVWHEDVGIHRARRTSCVIFIVWTLGIMFSELIGYLKLNWSEPDVYLQNNIAIKRLDLVNDVRASRSRTYFLKWVM